MIPAAVTSSIERLGADEAVAYSNRTRLSAARLEAARSRMPNGVPMAWMQGLYDHLPPWVTHGDGATFTDADGNTYLDFNLADLSAPAGFTPEPIVAAVREQLQRGLQFLLPSDDAVDVAALLAERFGLPSWQFTLAASTANVEAIRLARLATGRQRLVVFAGKYHGHIDDTLWTGETTSIAELAGLASQPAGPVTEIAFNDLDAVRRILSSGDIAAVMTEPALTNCGLVLADDGFLESVRQECTRVGTLMIVDETHTQMAIYGGLTSRLGLRPDIVTAGKGIGGGIPIGVYGMTAALAACMETHLDRPSAPAGGLAVGGTMFANAISMSAAKAGLTHVFTEARHRTVEELGARLADGLDHIFDTASLPWRAHRLGGRSGWCLEPELPRTAADAQRSLDVDFIRTRRLFFANRGVWDAIGSAGAHVGFAHDIDHVDRYLEVAQAFVDAITGVASCTGARSTR